MALRQIRPLVVKAYIGGDHKSLCDKCMQKEYCTKYSKTKRVFFCQMPYNRTKRIPEEERKRK